MRTDYDLLSLEWIAEIRPCFSFLFIIIIFGVFTREIPLTTHRSIHNCVRIFGDSHYFYSAENDECIWGCCYYWFHSFRPISYASIDWPIILIELLCVVIYRFLFYYVHKKNISCDEGKKREEGVNPKNAHLHSYFNWNVQFHKMLWDSKIKQISYSWDLFGEVGVQVKMSSVGFEIFSTPFRAVCSFQFELRFFGTQIKDYNELLFSKGRS